MRTGIYITHDNESRVREDGSIEDSAKDRGLIVVGKSSLGLIEPAHVPTDIRVVINSTIATANVEGQIASQRIRDFIMEFKEKYPNNSIKCTETISFTIEGEQTNSLLGYLLGRTPDTKFRITKAYRPDYQVE